MAQDYTDGDIVLGRSAAGHVPIEINAGSIAGSHDGSFPSGIDAGGTSNLEDAAFEGNVTIDGGLEVDSSGSGETVTITGNSEIQLGTAAGHQFIVRAVTGGVAALFIDSGSSTYSGAADTSVLYTAVHVPHLPIYTAVADANTDADLPIGQLYVVGGVVHVKL